MDNVEDKAYYCFSLMPKQCNNEDGTLVFWGCFVDAPHKIVAMVTVGLSSFDYWYSEHCCD